MSWTGTVTGPTPVDGATGVAANVAWLIDFLNTNMAAGAIGTFRCNLTINGGTPVEIYSWNHGSPTSDSGYTFTVTSHDSGKGLSFQFSKVGDFADGDVVDIEIVAFADFDGDTFEYSMTIGAALALVRYGVLGEDYGDPTGIPPGWYHPDAPVVAPALGEVLRIAYAVADRHGRTLTRSSAPPAQLGELPDVRSNGSWEDFPFGRGQPYVPQGVTHVVGYLDVETYQVQPGTIDFRLAVGADVGATMSYRPSTAPRVAQIPGGGAAPNIGVFAHVGNRLRARVEVQLSTSISGARLAVIPQFQCGATGNSLRALGGHCWWEVRRVV